MAHEAEIRQVKERYKEKILEKPHVVGVGIGYKVAGRRETDRLSIVALVRQKLPVAALPASAVLPQEVNGVPVDVIQIGQPRAQQTRRERWRPAPGGVSIGHYQITAGTFGCVVIDRSSGTRLILSNNHVLANSNDASIGDAILQPGPYDGGNQSTDTIARLERFCPILFTTTPGNCGVANAVAGVANAMASLVGSSHRLEVVQHRPQAVNQVDAAVARPLDDGSILNEVLDIGAVTGTVTAELGMAVRKSGRTTDFTTGTISVIDATVNVTYGAGRVATFENQLVAGPMSQGGDSGSLVVAGDTLRAVGLLFAGSDQSTIFSPIQFVLDCLEVDMPSMQTSGARESGRGQSDVQALAARAQAVKQAHEAELLSKPNVVGVGVGLREKNGISTGDVGLVVLVEKKVPGEQLSPQEMIPAEIEGVPVDVQEVGKLRAF
jgi:hypothetical protein